MRKLMWFAVGFVCACLLAVYALPESWLGWAGIAAALIAAVSWLFQRGQTTNAPHPPQCKRGQRQGPGGALRAVPESYARRHKPCLWAASHWGTFPRGGRLRRVLCTVALGLAVGLLWCWGYWALALAPARAAEGKQEGLMAELCSYPEETDYGNRADACIWVSGRRIKVRLYLYGELPELEPGDGVSGTFTLRRADRSADGDVFLGLQSAGILLTGSGRVEAVAEGGAPLRYFPARWSKAVFDRLGELIPADAAGLPQAMLTGNRAGLSEAVRSDLSAAGASHVVAVSGLHTAMLLGILVLVLGRGRRSALVGIPVLILFALMTGASPSVVRASLMLGLLLLAPIFREENDPPTSLALAALLILLVNPWAAANLSFQLSFAAVAGLLLVTKPLLEGLLALPRVKALLRWSGPKRWSEKLRSLLLRVLRGLVRFLCGSVSATLGALLFSAPIAAAAFGNMPVYGVLTNLVVLPLATICLAGALAVLALGLLSTALGAWAGWLLAWPVRGIYGICRGVARLPGSLLYMDFYGRAFLVFAFGVLLLTLLLREKRLLRPLLCLLAALIVSVGLQRLETASAQFTLAALDVGQGQCVCMLSPDFAAMVDCGGSGGASAGVTAADWLRRKGANRLDALILTHCDTDHISGAETLLSLVEVETVWLPKTEFDPENRAAVEAAALAAGAELRYVTEDQTLPFSGGQLRLFAPVSDRSDNAACVSVLYSVGEYDMLVTGDLDAGAEYALLEQVSLPRVELYVAGHHGSAGSSTQALLETIRPETVFISVGRNSYGLPSEEALARFAASGAKVYRTDECGNLEIGR